MEYIADNLRESDREEIHATVGHRRYDDALELSCAGAASAIIAVSAFGEPIAILGVNTASLLQGIGSPWFMATPRATQHKRALIDTARAYTAAMLNRYSSLVNHVDARNRVSINWLRRLGFVIEPPAPYGALNLPFHRFSIER